MNGRKLSAMLLVPFVAIACAEQGQQGERGQTGEEEMPGAEQQQTTAERDTAMAGGDEIQLEARNQSGVSGSAEWSAQQDSVEFTLSMEGLEQGQEYPAHVHQGDCASGGGVAVGLSPVTASDGSGESTATVARANFSAGQNYFVQVHLPDGTPAACGDVPTDAGLAQQGGQGQM